MERKREDCGVFEIWQTLGKPTGSITDKYRFTLRYRGRVIDFGETIQVWRKVVDRNPEWLQQKVREIDSYLETAAGKLDIEQGRAYEKQ